jgi:type II secretory pathway component PulF
MATFCYKARNHEGVLIKGRIDAPQRDSAVAQLKGKGYFPSTVEIESAYTAVLHNKMSPFSRINTRDKAIFTGQLSTLLKAGMQLSPALKTLTSQTANKCLTSVIKQLNQEVEQSSALSYAMARHPRIFSSVYVAIVRSAEQAGNLGDTLAVLSQQLKSQAAIRSRIRGAMLYPIFLLVVSGTVVGVLSVVVIPKFMKLFTNSGQALPLPTRVLIWLTTFCQDYWWVLLASVVGLILFFMGALRKKHFRMSLNRLSIRLPILGLLNRKMQLAVFTRTLGSLLLGGVRILPAIQTTHGITANLAFAQNITDIEQRLMKGSSLAEAVKRQPYFNEMTANMIAVGENAGLLPKMLLDIADMYDQDSELAIASVTNLIGPTLIVLLGGIIGFVVMAVLLPIFETTSLIT